MLRHPSRSSALIMLVLTLGLACGGDFVAPGGFGDHGANRREQALGPVFPPDEAFTAFLCDGRPAHDEPRDRTNSRDHRDLVGDAQRPAIFHAISTEHLFLRVRLNDDPRQSAGDLKPFGWGFLFDADGDPRTYEFLGTLNGTGSDTLEWWWNAPGAQLDLASDPGDERLQLVTTTSALPTRSFWKVDELASNAFPEGSDFHLTLAFPLTWLFEAGIDVTAQVTLWAATTSSNQMLDWDFACHAGGGAKLSNSRLDPAVLDPGGIHLPPETFIDSGPPASSGPEATFTFSSDRPDVTYECSLNGADFVPCDPNGLSLTDLPDGEHNLRVRAVGPTLARDPSPAEVTWRVCGSGGAPDGICGDDVLPPDREETEPRDSVPPEFEPEVPSDAQEEIEPRELVDGTDPDPNGSPPGEGFYLSGGRGLGCASAAADTWSALFGALVLVALTVRRRGRALLLAGVLAGLAAEARAQVVEPRNLSLERFRLAMDGDGLLGTEVGTVPEHLRWNVAVWTGYASNPLVLYRRPDGERAASLVGQRTSAALLASIGAWNRAAFALEVPLALHQGRPALADGIVAQPTPLAASGLGGVRLLSKIALLGARTHAIDLAVVPSATLPAITQDAYLGGGVIPALEVAASRAFGPVRAAANLGYRFRPRVQQDAFAGDDDVLFHFAAGFRPLAALELAASWFGSVDLGAFGREGVVSHELAAGATYVGFGAVALFAAAGTSVMTGFGVPDWRVVGGLRYQPASPLSLPARTLVAAAPPAPTPAPSELPPAPALGEPEPPVGVAASAPPPAPPPSVSAEATPELDPLRMHFAFDSAVLTEAGRAELDRFVRQWRVTAPGAPIVVEGHTDARGGSEYNANLARRRVSAAIEYLVRQGIERRLLVGVSHGADRPLVRGSDEEVWRQNRRVELRLSQGP